MIESYGYELIIDLKECDPKTFTRDSLINFFLILCRATEMEMCDIHFWDDMQELPEDKQTNPKTVGTTAVCFILTSNITVHTLTLRKEVFINFFSCKHFDSMKAQDIITKWFRGKLNNESVVMLRGANTT